MRLSRGHITSRLALVTACVTGIVTSVTMIGPLLVDIARGLGISLGEAGLLAAAAAVPQALGSPLPGLLSDRLGRRPMILLALGSVGALGFAAAIAPSFLVLAGIRFSAGLLGSLAPTSLMAAIGDLYRAERRTRAMGWFNMGLAMRWAYEAVFVSSLPPWHKNSARSPRAGGAPSTACAAKLALARRPPNAEE